jgi:DNA ligase-1
MGVLLGEVVGTCAAVAAASARTAKITAMAALLRRLEPHEIEPAVGMLAGAIRQRRTGVGWANLSLDVPPAAESSLTVSAVDTALTALTQTSGAGSAQRRRDQLTELLSAATADEQDFLRRLLVGELRQGALEAVLADAVAAAAAVPTATFRRALMLCGELGAAATAAITGGVPALEAFRLAVLRPVRPMLASPAESLDAALAELGLCVVEHKLDGARIQVHRQGADVRVFTRTLNEITPRVPELVYVVRALPCESVVLDGETLALTDDGRPRPFGETMSRFGAQSEREELLHPYFFDCLHLDGVDLIDEPLAARLAALDTIAARYRIPGAVTASPAEAAAVLAGAMAAGHEGVVVKSADSAYAAGRRGRAWQKIKPVHTLDLVVIGVEWGHGRRRGWLSNLHLGARDPDGGPPIMVGKTFKGMTDELLRWQTEQLQARAVSQDDFTVYVRPELVVEIELDGVQTSPRYPGGVALRFARVLRYRPDKDPADADTIDTVRALLPAARARPPAP